MRISLEHSIAYHGDEKVDDWTCHDDLSKFVDHPMKPPYPIFKNNLKFGQRVVTDNWRGLGKYYVTLASALGMEGKTSHAVIDAPGGVSEYRAVPSEFAPPTFPFLYHMNGFTASWISAFCLKNGKGLTLGDEVPEVFDDCNF